MKTCYEIRKCVPCKDCNSREAGCHSSCKLYNNWKSEFAESSQALFDENQKLKDIALWHSKQRNAGYRRRHHV